MAGAIAHNFNNQLGAVMGNIELVLEDLPQPASVRSFLTEALDAAHRAADISRLMLTDLGQQMVALEAVDLSEACHLLIPMLQDNLGEEIRRVTDLPGSGPVVRANANQIRQIVTRLIEKSANRPDK